MGVIFEANKAGVRVPEDLSVVGIDDHDFAEAVGLTTVGQRPDEQAELGTKMLLDELDGIAGAVQSAVAPHRLDRAAGRRRRRARTRPRASRLGGAGGAAQEARASCRIGIQREASRR